MSGEVGTVLIEPVVAAGVVVPVGRLAAPERSASTYAEPSDCVVATLAESDDDALLVEVDFVIVLNDVGVPVFESFAGAVPFVRKELARAGAVVCAA